MFKVGQMVIYSIYGIGEIIAIEIKKNQERKEKYYIINLKTSGMKVMIPIAKTDEIGIRPLISKREVNNVIKILKSRAKKMTDDWKTRYKNNLEKIKGGSIFELSEVVKSLHKRNNKKALSVMEKKLYENTLDLIIDELSIVSKKKREEMEEFVKKCLK